MRKSKYNLRFYKWYIKAKRDSTKSVFNIPLLRLLFKYSLHLCMSACTSRHPPFRIEDAIEDSLGSYFAKPRHTFPSCWRFDNPPWTPWTENVKWEPPRPWVPGRSCPISFVHIDLCGRVCFRAFCDEMTQRDTSPELSFLSGFLLSASSFFWLPKWFPAMHYLHKSSFLRHLFYQYGPKIHL